MLRGRLIAVAALLTLAATATAVQAAGGSTLALSGSHRNTLGQNFNYTIHGFAAAPANRREGPHVPNRRLRPDAVG